MKFSRFFNKKPRIVKQDTHVSQSKSGHLIEQFQSLTQKPGWTAQDIVLYYDLKAEVLLQLQLTISNQERNLYSGLLYQLLEASEPRLLAISPEKWVFHERTCNILLTGPTPRK